MTALHDGVHSRPADGLVQRSHRSSALTVFSVGVLWLHARWGRAQFDAELASLVGAISRVMHEELAESGDLKKAAFETRESMDVPDRATAVLRPGGVPLEAVWHGFRYTVAGRRLPNRSTTCDSTPRSMGPPSGEWRACGSRRPPATM